MSINTGITIEEGVKCDGLPRLILGEDAVIKIGSNVTIRKGVELRAMSHSMIIIGDNSKIDNGVRIIASNKSTVKIGSNSKIGFQSVLNGGGGIQVGDNSSLYGFVYLQSSSHNIASEGLFKDKGYKHASVVVGANVLLGAHSVILPGVEIADGTIVGANAVVTRSTEKKSIVLGVPAKNRMKY